MHSHCQGSISDIILFGPKLLVKIIETYLTSAVIRPIARTAPERSAPDTCTTLQGEPSSDQCKVAATDAEEEFKGEFPTTTCKPRGMPAKR